jgi:hypothetical protein
MAAPIRLLPFLDPAPYQIPFVDPKTGMMTDAWQRYHINTERVIFGVWTPVPFDATLYTTSGVATWNVIEANQLQLVVWQMGPVALVSFFISGFTVSADVPVLRLIIPTLRVALDTANDTYANKFLVLRPAGVREDGVVSVNHSSGAADAPVMLSFRRVPTADWLTADASIGIWGQVMFKCQSGCTAGGTRIGTARETRADQQNGQQPTHGGSLAC